jgi:trk system potassium uptake protein TrkA
MAGQFAVVGLGMFGRTVALSLVRNGQSVLAIDASQDEVNRLASELDAVVCADATDEAALRELRLERLSCAVVAIGAQSMESSILATALMRQIGVPKIVSRSLSELHTRVLYAVGAHEVVSPETEMGDRLARRLAHPNVLERLELGDGTELAEITVPAQFIDKTMVELDLRRKHRITVVGIRRQGVVRANLTVTDQLRAGDVLIAIGNSDDLARLAALV